MEGGAFGLKKSADEKRVRRCWKFGGADGVVVVERRKAEASAFESGAVGGVKTVAAVIAFVRGGATVGGADE